MMARKPSDSAVSRQSQPTSTGESVDKEKSRAPAEKPVSLHPLKFEEALRDLLKGRKNLREAVSQKDET